MKEPTDLENEIHKDIFEVLKKYVGKLTTVQLVGALEAEKFMIMKSATEVEKMARKADLN